jgi:hypothetical protein
LYSKPISKITSEDLGELLIEAAIENVRLEFKRELPDKDELIKKLSSFANTYGGWLVIGAEANSKDGKIKGLPGVEKVDGYKQKITQWCFNNISPPIDITISDPSPSPQDPSRFCYVLYVSESELSPHFLNGRKGIYIRTDEFSQLFEPRLATLDEILHLTKRRQAILDRARMLKERAIARFEAYVNVGYAEHGKNSKGLGAHFIFIISPRYPNRKMFEATELIRIVGEKNIDWRRVAFPRTTQGIISQQDSVLVLRPGSSFSLLEASIWGLLSYSTEIEIDTGTPHGREGGPIGIHLNHLLGHLLVFAEHARQMFHARNYTGTLSAQLNLRNIRNVPWIYFPDGFATEGPKSILDDSAVIEMEIDASLLIESRDAFIGNLLKQLLFALNWPAVASSDEQIQQLISFGYKYNMWQSKQQ